MIEYKQYRIRYVQLCKTRRHKSLQVMQLQAGTCRPQSAQCTAVLQCCREAVGGEEIREMQNWHLLIPDYRHLQLATLHSTLCNLVHTPMSSINHGSVTATHHISISRIAQSMLWKCCHPIICAGCGPWLSPRNMGLHTTRLLSIHGGFKILELVTFYSIETL